MELFLLLPLVAIVFFIVIIIAFIAGLYNSDRFKNPEEYKLLQDGISRIGNFIHSEKYTLDSAIINAAKVAYLSRLLENGINEIRHYTPDDIGMLASQALQLPMPTKLNKLKKTHPEAFFYLNEIQRMG